MDNRLDEVLLALEEKNHRDLKDELLGNMGTLQSFYYYSQDENVKHIVEQIVKADKGKRIAYIKGLIQIYPLSADILEPVMAKFDVSDMKNEISGWLDTSDTLNKMCNKFFSCVNGQNIQGEKSELQEQIEELEKRKNALAEERKGLNEIKKKNSRLRKEVKELGQECEWLKREFSQEALEKEKRKLEEEKKKYEREQKEGKAELERLRKELEPYMKSDNGKFDSAMEQLANILVTLPKDEADDEWKTE